ncbi:helix-turn-helix transcriptional regulator [Amycolatopsis viridis]|uniref:DNA-binding CsgD family transcriptional regulator n=1 Tax=Amycolatopsis viridis TaxID=185678 RepID=A0ABX0SUB7_9PSEU|nr:LuxR family transcriptional regulator [Amycolatopsis viridis]NIH79229.1 DNA-binding CsgD family transcriptional regulator [Amycolatopsis viridis]
MTPLHGRGPEQARLDTLLAAASAGSSGTLVLRGDPGIGKTALLSYAAAQARDTHGMTVVQAAGFETEAELPYASLHMLLHPALNRIDALPAPQTAALKQAFGLAREGGGDQLMVGLAVLSLLSELAADGPLLCLVDDAHWLDHSSARALLFAARRLHAEGIALVLAARDGFDAAGLPELRLAGLDDDSARDVLAEHAPGLTPPLRRRVLDESAGNPLALVELPSTVADHSRAFEPLPLPRRIQDAYAARIAELPSQARTWLLVVAAEDDGDLTTVLAASARLGADAGAPDAAERAGLVRIAGGRVSFAHPLMRGAALRAVTFEERLAAHRALAAVLTDRPDRRAWHLAAAATGPDEQAALALEESAARSRERNGHEAAAPALERAAELTADPGRRARRLIAAARAAVDAGLGPRAGSLLDTAARLTDDPRTRARAQALRARTAFDDGDPGTAHELLLAAAGTIAGGNTAQDRAEAGLLLVDAARNAWQLSDAGRLRAAADRLRELGPHPEHGLGPAAAAVYGAAEFLERGPAAALSTMRALVDHGRKSSSSPDLRVNAAFVAGLVGDFEAGREISLAVAAECRSRGEIGWLPLVHLTLTASELYLGKFRDAEASAADGLRIAADTGQPNRAGYLEGMLAWICAVRGEYDRCAELAAHCHDHFDTTGIVNSLAWAEWALALADLGRGRFAEALERLEHAQEGPVRRQIQSVYYAPDRIEAASRLGGHDRSARAALEQITAWAEASGLGWADAVLHRCRALMEQDWPKAHEMFRTAVRLHADTGRPWEAARTHLLFGERLRRERHKTDAQLHLRTALSTFERLRATPWADRARAELRAAGASISPRPGRDPAPPLSPQELRITRLAATGMSNREIAGQLFLSPKTVSYHLYRAFPKLGVTSRAQLAGLSLAD